MNTPTVICPHCGTNNARLLTDDLGTVGWCQECHRTWLAHTPRRQPPPRNWLPPDAGEERRRIA